MEVLHVQWLHYYWRCLFSVLNQDMRYHWRVLTPWTRCSLFRISHLSVLTHITWKLAGCIWTSANQMTAISWENIACVVYRSMSSTWRAKATDTHQSFAIHHCVRRLQAHCTQLYGAPLRHDNKLRYLISAYYTQTTALLPTTFIIITTNLASYTALCSVFSINRVR